ncbi:MAG: 3-oxoacyl-[acyl-carrier-protein] synthase III C-terminal domain-containing protein, partial [Sphingopyxis sp.]
RGVAIVGIHGFGAYLPITRLQRSAIHAANGWFAGGLKGLARGEKAVTGWDEDPITMAVEAARDLFGQRPRTVDGLVLASTTHVFADRQNAGVVKETLNLADNVGATDVGGSQRCATSALIAALDAAAAGRTTLHLSAERAIPNPASEGEMLSGDGAAALLVAPGAGVARLVAHHSVTMDFVDHFRATGQDASYEWEARWVRDEGFGKIAVPALRAALDQAGWTGESITHFIAPIAVRGVPDMLAQAVGIPADAVADPFITNIGHTGAAHPAFMLAHALHHARAGDRVAMIGFGQGCDALLFEATGNGAAAAPRLGVAGALARRVECANYMKYLFHRALIPLEKGARAEQDSKTALTALWRNRKTVMALVGGRCTKTGTVQFPKSDIGVNPNDHGIGTQQDYPLADITARIMTHTADLLAFSPNPPDCYGNIEFEGGGRMMAQFTDMAADDLAVGVPLRMVFRIKSFDENRHFRRYFWKAAPAF